MFFMEKGCFSGLKWKGRVTEKKHFGLFFQRPKCFLAYAEAFLKKLAGFFQAMYLFKRVCWHAGFHVFLPEDPEDVPRGNRRTEASGE